MKQELDCMEFDTNQELDGNQNNCLQSNENEQGPNSPVLIDPYKVKTFNSFYVDNKTRLSYNQENTNNIDDLLEFKETRSEPKELMCEPPKRSGTSFLDRSNQLDTNKQNLT